MTISLATAIRSCASPELFSDEKVALFTNLFEECITPFWGVGGVHWCKFSKKEMVPGGSLAAYESFGITLHLFDSNTLSFYLQKLESGGRFKVHIALLISQDEDGSYRVEPKVEKKLKKRCRTPARIEDCIQEYAFLRTLFHENIFSPREVIYYKSPFTKICSFEHYAKYNLLVYIESIKDAFVHEGVKKIVTIFKGVVRGLQYLNERNFVHRDIKLENVLLEENTDGELVAKIIDLEYRCNIIELESKVREFRDSFASSLDEPVYLALKKSLPPSTYEPLLSEYREALLLAGAEVHGPKTSVVINYLNRWESWLRFNIRICGTPAKMGLPGNIPQELLSRHIVVKEGDQFGFGRMMQDVIGSNPSLVPGFTRDSFLYYNRLIRNLVQDDYWKRPPWPEVLARLDEISGAF